MSSRLAWATHKKKKAIIFQNVLCLQNNQNTLEFFIFLFLSVLLLLKIKGQLLAFLCQSVCTLQGLLEINFIRFETIKTQTAGILKDKPMAISTRQKKENQACPLVQQMTFLFCFLYMFIKEGIWFHILVGEDSFKMGSFQAEDSIFLLI